MKVITLHRKLSGSIAVLFVLCLSAFFINSHWAYNALLKEQPPIVKKIRFETLEGRKLDDSTWVTLEDKVRIIVTVSGRCNQIDLIITETGTSTYKYQKIIDVVFPKNNAAEYVWEVPQDTRGHFWVVAYNGYVGRRSTSINVMKQ